MLNVEHLTSDLPLEEVLILTAKTQNIIWGNFTPRGGFSPAHVVVYCESVSILHPSPTNPPHPRLMMS